MKDDFLWGLTTQEFQKMLINALEQVIEPLKPAKESRSIELLTREETAKFFRNSGKLLLLPYTKDFGRITRF